jgi:hypothetical protein
VGLLLVLAVIALFPGKPAGPPAIQREMDRERQRMDERLRQEAESLVIEQQKAVDKLRKEDQAALSPPTGQPDLGETAVQALKEWQEQKNKDTARHRR